MEGEYKFPIHMDDNAMDTCLIFDALKMSISKTYDFWQAINEKKALIGTQRFTQHIESYLECGFHPLRA